MIPLAASPLVTLTGVPLGPWDPTTTAACEPLPSASTFSPSFQCVPPGTALPVAMTVHVQLGTVEVLFLSAGSATCDLFLAELHTRLGPGDVWQDGDTRATFRRDGAGPCSLYVSSTRVRRAGEAPPLGFETQPPFGFGPASVLGRPPLVSCEGGPGRWVCPAEVGGVPVEVTFSVEAGLYFGFVVRTDPPRCDALRDELSWLLAAGDGPDAGLHTQLVTGPDGCAVRAWSPRLAAAVAAARARDPRGD